MYIDRILWTLLYLVLMLSQSTMLSARAMTATLRSVRLPHILDANKLIDVYITSNEGEMQHWVNNHVYKPSSSIDRANHLAVGLDIEWKPSFSRGGNRKTAIIQISTLSSVLIAQVINHRQLPQPLIDLISDGQCKKVGVGILQDLEKIKSDFLASYRGYYDLALGTSRQMGASPAPSGLSTISKHYLGISMDKSKSISMSDWERSNLSDKQVMYAAYDALVSLLIYEKLRKDGLYEPGAIEEYVSKIMVAAYQDPTLLPPQASFRQLSRVVKESDLFTFHGSNTLNAFIINKDEEMLAAAETLQQSNAENATPKPFNYVESAKNLATRVGWTMAFRAVKDKATKINRLVRYDLMMNDRVVAFESSASKTHGHTAVAKKFCKQFVSFQRTLPWELCAMYGGKKQPPPDLLQQFIARQRADGK